MGLGMIWNGFMCIPPVARGFVIRRGIVSHEWQSQTILNLMIICLDIGALYFESLKIFKNKRRFGVHKNVVVKFIDTNSV